MDDDSLYADGRIAGDRKRQQAEDIAHINRRIAACRIHLGHSGNGLGHDVVLHSALVVGGLEMQHSVGDVCILGIGEERIIRSLPRLGDITAEYAVRGLIAGFQCELGRLRSSVGVLSHHGKGVADAPDHIVMVPVLGECEPCSREGFHRGAELSQVAGIGLRLVDLRAGDQQSQRCGKTGNENPFHNKRQFVQPAKIRNNGEYGFVLGIFAKRIENCLLYLQDNNRVI